MWGPVAIDGEQVVDIQSRVRAKGIRAVPRGNETHTVEFERCHVMDTVADAFAARMNGSTAVPRGSADVLIRLGDGRGWRIKNAAVRSWPGGQVERFVRERLSIIGGEMIQDYDPAASLAWEEITTPWESMTSDWES